MNNPLAKYEQLIFSIERSKTVNDAIEKMAKADALRTYTRKIGMDIKGQNLFAEARMIAERRAGELLRGMEKAVGAAKKRGIQEEPRETLSDIGISKKESSQWQQMADIPVSKIREYVKESSEQKTEATSAGVRRVAAGFPMPHVSHNTGDNEWYTPEEYIESARIVMGGIDLDPASSDVANKTVKAKKYYTAEDNGLLREWKGSIYLNPPYAGDLIGKFIEKLATSIENGAVTSAIVLVNNATETKWFQRIASVSQWMCFPASRIKFWHPEKVAAPLQGQAILYAGEKGQAFAEEFQRYGILAEVLP